MCQILISTDTIDEDKNIKVITELIFSSVKKGVFRSFLSSMCTELYYNSRDHGKSSEFEIIIEGNNITIKDNGSEFNPFSKEIINNIDNGGGTYTFKQFWSKFSSDYKYDFNYLDGNTYTFSFSDEFNKVNDNATCVIEIDFRIFSRRPRANQIKFPKHCKEYVNVSAFYVTIEYIIKETNDDTIIHINLPSESILGNFNFIDISNRIRIHKVS